MAAAHSSAPESHYKMRSAEDIHFLAPGRQTCKTSTLLGGWQPACLDEAEAVKLLVGTVLRFVYRSIHESIF